MSLLKQITRRQSRCFCFALRFRLHRTPGGVDGNRCWRLIRAGLAVSLRGDLCDKTLKNLIHFLKFIKLKIIFLQALDQEQQFSF